MADTVFAGIDVSRQTLEISGSRQTATRQASNDTPGTKRRSSKSSELRPALIVLRGHTDVQRTPYMVMLTGVCYNPMLRDYYQRPVQAGKQKKAALITAACIATLVAAPTAPLRSAPAASSLAFGDMA